MLFLFACSSVMIHEIPDKTKGDSFSFFEEPVADLLPVKGPDLALFSIKERYKRLPKKVFSGGHNINMRTETTVLSDVVAKIPLGHPITILETAKEATIGERNDFWYHVESKVDGKVVQGYLFGSTLTPHRITADLDMDGVEEQLLVVYNNKHEVLFRLYDPNGAAKTLWTNLGEYSYQGDVARELMLRLYPKEVIGRPMIRLDVACPEACEGRSWTKFVAYHDGRILRSLEYESEEKSEQYRSVDLRFNPISRNLMLSRIEGHRLPDGIFEQTRVVELWNLYGGVFRLQSTAPPLTELLPPPTILLEDPEAWSGVESVSTTLSEQVGVAPEELGQEVTEEKEEALKGANEELSGHKVAEVGAKKTSSAKPTAPTEATTKSSAVAQPKEKRATKNTEKRVEKRIENKEEKPASTSEPQVVKKVESVERALPQKEELSRDKPDVAPAQPSEGKAIEQEFDPRMSPEE